MHLSDLRSLIVEDDKPSKPVSEHPSPPETMPVASHATVDLPQPVAIDQADHSDEIYQRLAAKSDFTKTTTFLTLAKYLEPLKDMAIEEKTKFMVAVKQAVAQGDFFAERVVGVIDESKAILDNAAQEFSSTLASKLSDIEARKAKAQQDLEACFAEKQRLETAQHKFETALQTRQSELAQARAKYDSLLNTHN